MKKQLLSLFTIAVLISTASFSQTWEWAKRFGTNGADVGYNISVDKQGNSYIAGQFSDTINFGSNQLTANGSDIFFTKLDSNGNVLWALKYGGNGYDYGIEIISDSLGNCYLLGTFEDTLTIGNYTLVSAGLKDMFLARLDANLNVVWAKRGGGAGNDEAYTIRLYNSTDLYMVSNFEGVAYYDADSVISEGGYDYSLVKYDNNGNEIWVRSAGGTGMDYALSISTDLNSNVFIAGLFCNTCHFGTDSVISNGGGDAFIAKYDSAGNFKWVTSAGGNGDDAAIARVGKDNNIYVAGGFINVMTLGSLSLTTTGSQDIFVAKCDSTGKFLWAMDAGSIPVDNMNSMVIDDQSNIYLTGYYGLNAMFGSIAITGGYDIYVAKYDSTGTAQWVKTANGSGSQSTKQSWGIAESNGCVYVTGGFRPDLNFDNSPLSFSSTTTGNTDVFVAKINQLPTGINELNVFTNSIAIYPNPATTTCTITAPNFINSSLVVYDITGRKLLQQKFNEQTTINVAQLKAGMYMVEIKDKEGKNVQGKLVKE